MGTDIARWDPLREMTAVRAYVDRLLGLAAGEPLLPGHWSPTADVIETDDAIVITAELPGVKDEDIEITVRDHLVHISGERRLETEASEGGRHRIERSYGRFERTFRLPPGTDPERIHAGVAYGVLKITVPKAGGEEPRRIPLTPSD